MSAAVCVCEAVMSACKQANVLHNSKATRHAINTAGRPPVRQQTIPGGWAIASVQALTVVGLTASGPMASGSSFDFARLTFARPSVSSTTMTRPQSPCTSAHEGRSSFRQMQNDLIHASVIVVKGSRYGIIQ